MTSYDVATIKCPGCGSKLAAWDCVSSNTFGAKFFTDGYVYGSPQTDALLACPKCKANFWRKGIKAIRSVRHGDAASNALPIADSVPMKAYPALLKAPWRTAEEEKYVRIRAWWAWNEMCRDCDGPGSGLAQERPQELVKGPDQKARVEAALESIRWLRRQQSFTRERGCHGDAGSSCALPETAQVNLERLLELLGDIDEGELIMQGEILRELGRFQECLTLFARPFNDRYMKVVQVIMALAQEGKRYVRQI